MMALSTNEEEVEGYIASTQNLTVTHNLPISVLDRIDKLGRTNSANIVTVRIFGGTDMQLGWTDMVRVRA